METTHISENEHYNRGITFFDHGLYAEAAVEFERVVGSMAEDAPERKLASFYMCEAYMNLGLSHLSMGMYHRAEEDLGRALAIHPEYADLRLSLGLVCYRGARYDQAEKELKHALAVNPRYAKALIYLGLTRLRCDNEEGFADIAHAVMIERAYDDERYQSALALYRAGSVEQAVELLEEVAEVDVDQVSYLIEKARVLMKQRDYPTAANTLLEAVSICPHYADVRHSLGLCYLRQGMVELAAGQFAKALEINPSFITARINLALAHEKEGSSDLASKELQHVLHLDPDNHIAARMLAKLHRDK